MISFRHQKGFVGPILEPCYELLEVILFLVLRKVERKKFHPLIHKIHKKHKISKKTLLYVKEYGPKSHVLSNILKESIKILLFSSVISLAGGLALENTRDIFISLVPLIILFPTLNDMIGDYGIIISSRFTTLLHMGKIRGKWYKNYSLKKLFFQIFFMAIVTTLISSLVSLIVSSHQGFVLNFEITYKVFIISIIDVILLVCILFIISVYGGYYYYKKNEDPANFLIPISTAIADFGNMVLLSILVILFF